MRAACLAFALCLTSPALAQEGVAELPDEIAGSEAMASAAQAIVDAGAESVLLAGLIGSTVAGPGGEALGTVENLAAVPGGRLVAALMTLEDGTRIAVPYQALKVTGAAETLEATLPLGADELRGMDELTDLASQLDGRSGG